MSTPGQAEEFPNGAAPDSFSETMVRPLPPDQTVSLEKHVSLEKQTVVENPGQQYSGQQHTGQQYSGQQYGATQIGQSPYPGPQYSNTQYANTQYSNTQYANTQYAGSAYSSGEYPGGYPSYPSPQPSRSGGGGTRAVLLGLAIACILGLAAAAVFVWLKVADSGDDSQTTAQPGVTTEQQQPTTPTPTVPADPEMAAGESLRNQAATDAADVRSNHNNQWTAQVSSKRLGLVAEGTTWNNQAIWSEFESSRARYPQVKLIDSGQWPVFSESGWWVTVSAQNFSTPEAALAWCRSAGLDKDHCFAKLISDSRGPEGTTLYQR